VSFTPACRKEVAVILEQAERAAVRWEVTYTHFYSPPVVADALKVLEQMSDVTAVAWGGYPQAERCRIAMGREDVMMVGGWLLGVSQLALRVFLQSCPAQVTACSPQHCTRVCAWCTTRGLCNSFLHVEP
jgi:hypothetical protein